MMPVRMGRNKNGTYHVTDAGHTTAKATTKDKAEKQARLLRGLAHGWHPARNP